MKNSKAYVAGVGAVTASPFSDAFAWALEQYLGMPPGIAGSLSVALAGLLVGLVTYYIPNTIPPSGGSNA